MSHNPFLNRLGQEKKQSKAYWGSKKQEKNLAARLKGGYLVSGSGSGKTKGDVRVKNVARIEAKLTGADSFRVTKSMLEKITNAALVSDEIPAIVVGFLGADGKPDKSLEVMILPSWALGLLQADAKKDTSSR